MKLYRHQLVTKYPGWKEANTSIALTQDEDVPFNVFNPKKEEDRILENAELARKKSLERGEDGNRFVMSWYTQMSEETFLEFAKQGIALEVGYRAENYLTARAVTVDDYIKLQKALMIIPEQVYSVTEVWLDESFIRLVDKCEAMAQASWPYANAEVYCARQYQAAMDAAETDVEKEYVTSRSWC